MKIVDVNPFFLPRIGGIELRMHDMARYMAKRGHDVTVLTGQLEGTPEEEMTPDGYRIVRLRSKFLNIYNPPHIKSYDILETLKSLDADIVNYNYRWAPSWDKEVAKYDGKRIFTYHNMWGEGTGLVGMASGINDSLYRKKLMSYDHIVCVSEFVRQDLIRRGIPADMTTTIPNGYECKPLVDVPEGDFILSLGRLVKTKGLDYLMEAMKLVMCGKGPEKDHLEKLIVRYGLQDKVTMKGFVSDEEKLQLMSTCKFFVIPSLFESFGIAALEQMASGKPVVSTNVNGLPEVVGDGGIMVDPRDSKALAEAMNRLLGDDALRHDLGVKARKQAETYEWSGIVDSWERFLEGQLEN